MTNESFNIVSIDPGNNIGVSIIEVELPNYNIINIDTTFIVLENNISKDSNDKILDKLNVLNKIVSDLINIYNPVAFSIEAAFMNVRFPKAVMQLSQYVGIIDHTIQVNNPFIKVFKYPPKYIKARVVGSGNADKDAMMIGVTSIEEIASKIDTSRLSEHEVDAVAIGYTALQEIREFPFILYTSF